MSYQVGARRYVGARSTFCRYSALACVLLVAVLAHHLILQLNCQRHHTTSASNSGAVSNCNQKQNQSREQHRHQRQPTSRQQRQFNQLKSPKTQQQQVADQQQQQQQQQQSDQLVRADSEQEEFSLALGTAATGGQQQQAAISNFTLLPANQATHSSTEQPAQVSIQSADNQVILNTTPANPSDSIISPVALQPPATTTSSIANTAPSAAAKTSLATASSAATTTMALDGLGTTSVPTLNADASQGQGHANEEPAKETQHTRATGRRMEDGGPAGVADLGAADQYQGQRHSDDAFTGSQMYPTGGDHHLQSVSSAPSSISIITPLLGSPTQSQSHTTSLTASIGGPADGMQQQQQSMMKPIFVVGNPISERDYGNSLYYHQYQAPPQQAPQQPQVQAQPQPPVAHSPAVDPSMQQKPAKAPVEAAHSSATETQSGSSAQAPKVKTLDSQTQHAPRFDKSQELAPGEPVNELANATAPNYSNPMGDRISGPPLVYSDGRLQSSVQQATPEAAQSQAAASLNATLSISQQPASPRLFQGQSGAAVVGNSPRRPSLPPPVNQANAASGFRSPMSPSGPLLGTQQQQQQQQPQQQQQQQQTAQSISSLQPPANPHVATNFYQTASPYANANTNQMLPLGPMYNNALQPNLSPPTIVYSKQKYILNSAVNSGSQQSATSQALSIPSSAVPTPMPGTAPGSGRRPLNITRVEHISAECTNDLIRAVIVFNGTFRGIIYSSGYVNDPTCLYVNGTGSTRYEFNIRLNQCGTLGRQELHQPTIPGEARRRDQVMWNTLSIQYNSIIEQEWDEHFRVSCEYGSDFWKTVSFSPFNVETNTGSPVMFTINPPQCQMDVLLGHGMGPKIGEQTSPPTAVDGPVTVGDPLTLLIHMKSEKAGYDILVKNCLAHNGGKQRMQLIDSNGCVVNERFISPFRGTYNDNDLRHVTLYAYLKAFRFTGSPVLYLECEIHMCQSACPPQMCYWRRLSKRSVDNFDYEYTTNSSSNSLATTDSKQLNRDSEQPIISDSLNLFKALQVRQESEPLRSRRELRRVYGEEDEAQLVCYRHAEVLVFITTMASLLVLVFTIALTCWIRVRKLTRSQLHNSRLLASSSLSPSLLSIGDAISNAGSFVGTGNSLLSLAAAKTYPLAPGWQQQQRGHHQSGAQKLPPNLYQARPHVYHSQQTGR